MEAMVVEVKRYQFLITFYQESCSAAGVKKLWGLKGIRADLFLTPTRVI